MLEAATLPQILPPGYNEPWPLTNLMKLRAAPGAVPRARNFATNALHRWNFPEQLVNDAEIVTSELVTNAVQACARDRAIGRCMVQPVTLAIRSNFGQAVVEVGDPIPQPPQVREHDLDEEDAEGGWGLHFVSFFSESWGYYTTGSGKFVWACFTRIDITE